MIVVHSFICRTQCGASLREQRHHQRLRAWLRGHDPREHMGSLLHLAELEANSGKKNSNGIILKQKKSHWRCPEINLYNYIGKAPE